MSISRISISLFICMFVVLNSLSAQDSLASKGQDTIRLTKQVLDSITDVEKEVITVSLKENQGAFVYDEGDLLEEERVLLSKKEKSIIKLYTPYNRTRNNKGLIVDNFQWEVFPDSITMQDTVIINPALLPAIFEGRILPDSIDFRTKYYQEDNLAHLTLIDPNETFSSELNKINRVHSLRKMYYTSNPQIVKIDALNVDSSLFFDENITTTKHAFRDLLKVDKSKAIIMPHIVPVKIKLAKWKMDGEHELKVSQAAFSGNWKGEERDHSVAVINNHKVNLNFRHNKFTLDNMVEWKLDFMSSPADTLHSFAIQNDYVKLKVVAGYEAFSKWSYTLNMLLSTPLFNSYDKNSPTKKSALFSPMELNLGLGMRYILEKKAKDDGYNNMKFVVNLAPLSLNYKYVNDRMVDETSKGLKKGQYSKAEIGSTIDMEFTRNFNSYTVFYSRLRYYTNYERTEAESENKFTFQINKYFSTSLFLHVRFDDAVSKAMKDKTRLGYFQINEVLGIGLGYRW